jgi:hypothetical protein
LTNFWQVGEKCLLSLLGVLFMAKHLGAGSNGVISFAFPFWGQSIRSGIDMSVPALVFGALLAVAAAGAISENTNISAQVLNDEGSIGLNPNDPATTCGHERSPLGSKCRKSSNVIQASLVR